MTSPEEKEYQQKEFHVVDTMLANVLTDIDDLNRKVKELQEISVVDLRSKEKLLGKINSLEESLKITYEAGMKLENDSNVHIQRLDLAALKIGDLIRQLDNENQARVLLERDFREHTNPDILIPRFKTEILQCLEDNEFRISLLKLLFPTADSFDYYTRPLTTAKTPPEKQFGTWFEDPIPVVNPLEAKLKQAKRIARKRFNKHVRYQKEIKELKAIIEQTCRTDQHIADDMSMGNHVPDIGKMVISKLDTADLDVNNNFIVFLSMEERMWLRNELEELK